MHDSLPSSFFSLELEKEVESLKQRPPNQISNPDDSVLIQVCLSSHRLSTLSLFACHLISIQNHVNFVH